MNPRFGLALFTTDPALIHRAVASGVDSIVVDWEHIGKEQRQSHADTQINQDTLDDLQRVRASTEANVICRINRYGATTVEEVEQAVGAGADEVLLPMVQTAEEVEVVLDLASGRCGVGILIETVAAVARAEELAGLPLSRVYIGLNDLAIERRTAPRIFAAVADGTVERVRAPFRVPFGFGGLTLPDRGFPVPSRLLIGEMVRLGCDFSFLRRSFHRDVQGRDLTVEIPRILDAILEARRRSPPAVARDRKDFEAIIEAGYDQVDYAGRPPANG
jgi:hypothetical protein